MCFGTTTHFTCCGNQVVSYISYCDVDHQRTQPAWHQVRGHHRTSNSLCTECQERATQEDNLEQALMRQHRARAKRVSQFFLGHVHSPIFPQEERGMRTRARATRQYYENGESLHPWHPLHYAPISVQWRIMLEDARRPKDDPKHDWALERLSHWAECVARQKDIDLTGRAITDEDREFSLLKLEDPPALSFQQWCIFKHQTYTLGQWAPTVMEQLRVDLISYEDEYLFHHATKAQLWTFQLHTDALWREMIDADPAEGFPSYWEYLNCHSSRPERGRLGPGRYPLHHSMMDFAEFLESRKIHVGILFRMFTDTWFDDIRWKLYKQPRQPSTGIIKRFEEERLKIWAIRCHAYEYPDLRQRCVLQLEIALPWLNGAILLGRELHLGFLNQVKEMIRTFGRALIERQLQIKRELKVQIEELQRAQAEVITETQNRRSSQADEYVRSDSTNGSSNTASVEPSRLAGAGTPQVDTDEISLLPVSGPSVSFGPPQSPLLANDSNESPSSGYRITRYPHPPPGFGLPPVHPTNAPDDQDPPLGRRSRHMIPSPFTDSRGPRDESPNGSSHDCSPYRVPLVRDGDEEDDD